MEEVLIRFSHLGEDIFDSLQKQSLVTCNKVCRTWNVFIKDRKFFWIRIIEVIEAVAKKSLSRCGKKWKKFFPKNWRILLQKVTIEELREFAKMLIQNYRGERLRCNAYYISTIQMELF